MCREVAGISSSAAAVTTIVTAQRYLTKIVSQCLQRVWQALHCMQGAALTTLERYEEAEAAFLEGLALEPGNPEIITALTSLRRAFDDAVPSPTGSQTPRPAR